MSKKVSDILPKTEILAQLAEEASELAQAALKLRRALDGTNPTPKSVAECEANLIEEFADISNAINSLCEAWFGDDLDSECVKGVGPHLVHAGHTLQLGFNALPHFVGRGTVECQEEDLVRRG